MAYKEIFDLTESPAPSLTDYTFNGHDPSGVPVLRRTTWQTIRNLFLGTGSADGDFTIYNGTTWAKKTLAETKIKLGMTDIGGVAHKQLWIANWKPTLTSGCGEPEQIEMGTNDTVFDYLAFDASTIEYAYANVPMPDDYSGGTIYAKFYWTHPAATAFKVSWGLQAVAISNDDAMDVAQGTAIYSNDEGGTTTDLYISPLTAAITIAGTPAAGDLVQFRASRKADDATNDTLDVDAYLIGAMVYYPVG